ncbi:hypothetical protein V5O48_010531 [Marasmius crinis-equi]|uniref:Afadin and alpha-actinin-binding-domain-containing protein n=1 Tax=Marasmius crinis-equi TaxID=585013 RepID=A0ABR3F8K3_9AGAR
MAATPANSKKLVHWDKSPAVSEDFDSISLSLPNDSTDSFVSTSSLQYVNAQLVAHGFTPTPGLSLEGISNDSLNRVTKCLMDMLAQRVKDMSRAEQLSTEIRTMNYDYERMKSMHQSASESSANLERELSTQRSRLAAITRTLQQAENTQKQTMLDLQRTRSSLQTVRATHQAELRKKDKELERMADKWLKIADGQAKLGSAASGIRYSSTPANAAVLGGGQFGKGKGYMETALEQAEKARDQLNLENTGLRMTILRVANELQKVVHEVKRYMPGNSKDVEDPPAFTLATLFPLSPADFTNDTLTFLLMSLEQSLCALESYYRDSLAISSSSAKPTTPSATGELERLHGVVESLQAQLKESQQQSLAQTSKAQVMFDEFAHNHRVAKGRATTDTGTSLSMDLITAPERDQELERLNDMRRALEEERRTFTEATIQLGRERAELQADRHRLNEEKRKMQVDTMLGELPPTPLEPSAETFSPGKKRRNTEDSPPSKKLKVKPSRKTPLKSSFGRGLGVSRNSKRASLSASYAVLTSPSKRPPKFEPAFETEVIPSPSLAPPPALLPTSFVLPPPSPKASFPAPQPALLLSTPFEVPPISDMEDVAMEEENPRPSSSQVNQAPLLPLPEPPKVPETPGELRRTHPFPVAKPFAPRMIHAYSPARPSPLSRILMLGNSPDSNHSNDSGLLDPVPEEDMFPEIPLEDRMAAEALSVPLESSGEHEMEPEPAMTLAQELGVSESPPESPAGMRPVSPPLQERRGETNAAAAAKKSTTTKGRVLHGSAAAVTKSRGATATAGSSKGTVPPRRKPVPTIPGVKPSGSTARLAIPPAGGVVEKENKGKAATSSGTQPSGSGANPSRPKSKPAIPNTQAGVGRGAPRRVPIGSADAPPPGRSRK